LAWSLTSKDRPLHEEASEWDGCEEGGVGYECKAVCADEMAPEATSSISTGPGIRLYDMLRLQRRLSSVVGLCGRCLEDGDALGMGRSDG